MPGGAESRPDLLPDSLLLTTTSLPVPAVTLMLPDVIVAFTVAGCDGLESGTVILSWAAAPKAHIPKTHSNETTAAL
jgi:hypothetical protein